MGWMGMFHVFKKHSEIIPNTAVSSPGKGGRGGETAEKSTKWKL